MSILKSELENYKLNQQQEQSDVLLMVPETNIEKNNIVKYLNYVLNLFLLIKKVNFYLKKKKKYIILIKKKQ